MGALMGKVVLEDLGDWLGVREGNQLVVLSDILPVIYKHRLNVIRHRQVDHGLVVKGVFL